MCYFLSPTLVLFVTCACFILCILTFSRAHASFNPPSLQRAKEEIGDRHPSYLDTGYAIGVVLLFVSKLGLNPSLSRHLITPLHFKVSGIILTVELPNRCYSGPNEHFKAIGQAACNVLTVMAVLAWLGVLTSKFVSCTIEST